MATDQHPHSGRRLHFHRNRRGHDRRGDRRPSGSPPPQQDAAQASDHVDVDQIVREIKARISQRHGLDLSAQQIQELAARRLDAILDPRTVKPGLLDQLRRAAGAPAEIAPAEPADAYTFEDHTIYDTHNGLLRFLRRLLNPLLKLFFNPNPIAAALNAQARVNREVARREAERERTQAEWNALHYTILQRLVTEVSRVSLEMQSLSLRIESLATRADFTERRIRGLETPPAAAPQPRALDVPPAASAPVARQGGEAASGEAQGDGSRRRRRRRRGRRSGVPGGESTSASPNAAPPGNEAVIDAADGDDEGDEEAPDTDGGELEAVEMIDASPSAQAFTAPAAAPPAPEPPVEAPVTATTGLPPQPATPATPSPDPHTSDAPPPADRSDT